MIFRARAALVALCLGLTLPTLVHAQSGRAGLRFGAGTDISGGVAYGGQIDYTLPGGRNVVELGLMGLGGTYEEDSNNGFNDYHEETTLVVVGAVVNYLLNHDLDTEGPYFVLGGGVGGILVEWREESPTDTSLGSPLPGGGSFQEEDGTVGGLLLNVGIGHRFDGRVDIRAQLPTLFIAAGEERESQIVPGFVVTLGIGF